jgi:FtsH-binding integral membrane protein
MAAAFYGISAIFGISFAIIFLAYSGESIARVFFITAGTFAGTSAIGYSSKRDLSGVGAFGMMGMWGIFLAFLVNMFMHSPMVMYVSSMIGVIACVCLIAWNTQMFKEMYNHAADRESNQKLAILAALNLYMSFINLFQFLLNLMGNRR